MLRWTAWVPVGLVPALRLAGTDMHESLKEGGQGATSGERPKLRADFVVTEVALAVMLMIGARHGAPGGAIRAPVAGVLGAADLIDRTP